MTFKSSFLELIIFLKETIKLANFFNSTSISLIPKAVSFWSLKSKIAITCFSLSSYDPEVFLDSISLINLLDLLIFHFVLSNDFFASSGVLEDFIILITLSIFSTLVDSPINMWALSSAFFKSCFVFFITTSCLNIKNFSKNFF